MRLIKVLEGPVAKYLPATGIMLLSGSVAATYDSLVSPAPDQGYQEDRIVFTHEVIHHLQVLSSAYLWQDAVARIDMALDLLHPRGLVDQTAAAMEITRRERAWRYRAFGVSVADLCEGEAVLESYKARAAKPSAEEFLRWRDFAFPGKGNSPYRRTFDILADQCGADAAFDLLSVITFLALQGDIPGRSFEILVTHPRIKSGSLAGAMAKDILEALDFATPTIETLTPENLEHLHPKLRHPTLYPALVEACRSLNDSVLETFMRPHRALRPPLNESLLPPIIVGAHQQGGPTSMAFGAARASKELRLKLHLYTALVSAARRIVTGTEDFLPCPHAVCPNHPSGICAGWLVPPPDPELCRFRAEVRALDGKEPHQIAEECTPLINTDAFSRLRASTDISVIFPSAELMPKIVDDERETCAEQFDQRHLLDPEDNDAYFMSTCPVCGEFWQEWVSHRKLDMGYMAKCPNCGSKQYVQTDRVITIQM